VIRLVLEHEPLVVLGVAPVELQVAALVVALRGATLALAPNIDPAQGLETTQYSRAVSLVVSLVASLGVSQGGDWEVALGCALEGGSSSAAVG
jgi:hypothetical protein